MAVDGINGINSVLPSTLQVRQSDAVLRPPFQSERVRANVSVAEASQARNAIPQNVQQANVTQPNVNFLTPIQAQAQGINQSPQVQAVAETDQTLDAIRQNALEVSETLRNLSRETSELADTLLLSTSTPFLRVIEATQELSAIQESALRINEALLALTRETSEPDNILLINQISPELEAGEVTEDLKLTEETALRINETLQDLGVSAERPSPLLPAVELEEAEVVTGITVTEPRVLSVAIEGAAEVQAAAIATESPEAEVTPAGVAAPLPAPVTPEEVTPPTEAAIPEQEIVLGLPQTLTRPDLTPYVLAVYEIRNPNPVPGAPEPVMRDVQPLTPISGIRAIGGAALRQALARGTPRTQEVSGTFTPPGTLSAEKSIRFSMDQVNKDMADSGLPLRLVFAKHGEEFALDVYECSDTFACWLTYEVPVAQSELMTVLSSLQYETGIIFDARS